MLSRTIGVLCCVIISLSYVTLGVPAGTTTAMSTRDKSDLIAKLVTEIEEYRANRDLLHYIHKLVGTDSASGSASDGRRSNVDVELADLIQERYFTRRGKKHNGFGR